MAVAHGLHQRLDGMTMDLRVIQSQVLARLMP